MRSGFDVQDGAAEEQRCATDVTVHAIVLLCTLDDDADTWSADVAADRTGCVIVLEALQFDPLAQGFKRLAREEHRVAAGSRRARQIPAGATVFAATASAMMDGRRLA